MKTLCEYVNDVEENMVNNHNDGSVPSGPLPMVAEMRTLQTLQQFLVFSPTDLSPASTAPTMPRVACSEKGCQQSSQLPMSFLCLMVLDKPNKQTVLSLWTKHSEVQERRSISVSWRKTLLWRSEERCDEPSNTSVFSGVSDRSIILRNSNLWEGNTSQVNLGQLMAENNLMTKMSRPGVSISETFPAIWVVWMKAKLKATDQDLALFTLSDYQREGETIYSRVAVVLMAKDSWRGLGKHLV